MSIECTTVKLCNFILQNPMFLRSYNFCCAKNKLIGSSYGIVVEEKVGRHFEKYQGNLDFLKKSAVCVTYKNLTFLEAMQLSRWN